MNNKALVVMILLAIVSCGLYYRIGMVQDKLALAEREKLVLEEKIAISQASVKSLQLAINEQNAAVEKFKNDAAEREKNNQILINKAKNEAERNAKRASDFMNRKPDPNQPICKSADDLINEAIRNAKTK